MELAGIDRRKHVGRHHGIAAQEDRPRVAFLFPAADARLHPIDCQLRVIHAVAPRLHPSPCRIILADARILREVYQGRV